MGENAEKRKALEVAMSQIEKQFGKGSVMKLGEYKAMEVEAIPTGALSLDIALGIGGVPRGRIIEVFGPESSGKTTLALHIIAEAQKMGGEAAFIDAEHALDPVYARKLGVDIDNLIVSQPDTGEQALEITEALVRSGALDVVVVDSVAALVPKAEIDGETGDSHVGLQARLMSQALRKLAGAINKSKTVLIFINQLREKIGVMFGNPETTTGGRALKFYASVRMDIRKTEMMKQDGQVIGNRVRVKVIKNKVAPPFREAEFDVLYGKGISKEGNIVDLGVNLDIIEKSGSWFSYDGTRIGQGRENVKRYLIENPEIMKEIENKIRDNFSQAFEKSLADDEPKKDKKDKEDKIYASGHSLASAILGFVASTIITSPLDTAIQKLFRDPEKFGSKKLTKMKRIYSDLEKRADLRNSAGEIVNRKSRELFKAMNKHKNSLDILSKNIPDWIIAVPRSILTIALIPPILKYVFGVEKKKAAPPQKDNNMQPQMAMNMLDKPIFKDFQFKGGVN